MEVIWFVSGMFGGAGLLVVWFVLWGVEIFKKDGRKVIDNSHDIFDWVCDKLPQEYKDDPKCEITEYREYHFVASCENRAVLQISYIADDEWRKAGPRMIQWFKMEGFC